MREVTSIFIDDGDVMNDNTFRTPEWRRLVGEYFAPRLGGSADAWREANRVVFEQWMLPLLEEGPQGKDWISWYNARQIQWLREMASRVGVAEPINDVECLELVWQASDYITQRVKSAFPGVIEAIKLLHTNGFKLFTSSGEHSRQLDGHLKCMGVRDCFKVLYGSDIINYGKYSEEFYMRVFEHSHVNPREVLVVDDKPEYLAWAASLGAKTCLVRTLPNDQKTADFVITKLVDLPAALDNLK